MTTENVHPVHGSTGKVLEKMFICDKCLSPACFEGIFYCDDYKKAGTIEYILKSVADKKVRDATKHIREVIKTEIPSNWCDPLLSGKNKILKSEFNCNEIEQLLFAIEERLLKRINGDKGDSR